MSVLQIDDLTLRLGRKEPARYAVHGLSLTLEQGKTYALLGESGCGKSLTAYAVMKLLPNSVYQEGGQIHFGTQSITNSSEADMRTLRGQQISLIFQEPMTALNPVMTIAAQLIEAMQQQAKTRLPYKTYWSRASALMDEVGITDPEQCLRCYPHQLSGGMKQRVVIAMALSTEPSLLLADEPTTALDVTIQQQILTLLKTIQKNRHLTILFITHDLGVAAQMADEICVMYNGQLVEKASTAAFFDKPMHPYSALLLSALPTLTGKSKSLSTISGLVQPVQAGQKGCRFAPRCPLREPVCTASDVLLREQDVQHAVRCVLYENKPSSINLAKRLTPSTFAVGATVPGETILSVCNLRVHYPLKKGLMRRTYATVKAVDDVSFTLATGKTLAIVGESGSGKSTLAKAIARLEPVNAGTVQFLGQDWLNLEKERLRQQRHLMPLIFQDPYSSMSPKMNVGSIIAEGLDVCRLFVAPSARQARIDELLQEVGLPADSASRFIHEFSGGQRQRISIARALAMAPKLLLCDEPTSALDVSVQAQILNLLTELQQRLQLSYLFISHNISVVAYLADEIAVMYQGKIVEQGAASQILNHPAHPYTKRLLSAVVLPP